MRAVGVGRCGRCGDRTGRLNLSGQAYESSVGADADLTGVVALRDANLGLFAHAVDLGHAGQQDGCPLKHLLAKRLGCCDLGLVLRRTHLEGHDRSNFGRGVTLLGNVGKGLVTGCLSRCLRFVGVNVGLVLFGGAARQGKRTEDSGDGFHGCSFKLSR